MYSYPQSQRVSKFQKLKGLFLTCSSITRAVLGEPASIFSFQMTQQKQDQKNQRGSNSQNSQDAMINNVKVRPVLKVDSNLEASSDSLYKASFANIPDENLLIVIVLPFLVPDSIVKAVAVEAKSYLDQLMKAGFINVIDTRPNDLSKINNRLNQIFSTLFYQNQLLALQNMISDSAFAGSPLGVTPLALPTVLQSQDRQHKQPIVQLNLSEKLLLDASEFLNAVYDDMSSINELLTLKDQTLLIEGCAMFYRGFQVVNSLEAVYLKPLIRIININDMFERSNSSSEETLIDYFYLRSKLSKKQKYLQRHDKDQEDIQEQDDIHDLSADLSLEADDDYIHHVIEQGNYVKLDEESKDGLKAQAAKKSRDDSDDDDDEDEEEKRESIASTTPNVVPKAASALNANTQVDIELKKLLNEIEIKFRKDESAEVREKRSRKKRDQNKTKKLATIVGRGQLIVGVVCHVLGDDNTGEFDPYFVERIKNAMQIMIDKHFLEVIENDISENNTFNTKIQAQEEPKKDSRAPRSSSLGHSNIEILESSRRFTDKKKNQIFQDPNMPQQANDFMNKQGTSFGLKKNEYLSNQRTLQTNMDSPGQQEKRASQKQSTNILNQIDNEFRLATISMHQIQGHQRKRSGSVTGNKSLQENKSKLQQIQNQKGQGSSIIKIQPILDNISGVKIYHYALLNNAYASILSKNLLSSIIPSLKEQADPQPVLEEKAESIDDIMDYIESQLNTNVIIIQLIYLQQIKQLKQKFYNSSGSQIFKVYEQGLQVDLPVYNQLTRQSMTSIWIVCKVLTINQELKTENLGSSLNLQNGQDEDEQFQKFERNLKKEQSQSKCKTDLDDYKFLFLAYENDIITTQRDAKGNLVKDYESSYQNISNIAYKLSVLNFF
ncbi:UNKNOWN [Stylonychia lemnae]|uniref:Uncharacterized protein n=1 Tax=Stylonychia lemnae TaxID=5949 RepID=A0A077ZVA9_STYLE|nr:UNKNOWN [Stylonychia lemnae]|eukprot:CDW73564.1 UNKNOWN [Stylonychia lemnae]